MGPAGRTRKMTTEQECQIVAICRQTNRSLDKCLIELTPRFPWLTRSTLYRILKRYPKRISDRADFRLKYQTSI
jgi:hypothetical protein